MREENSTGEEDKNERTQRRTGERNKALGAGEGVLTALYARWEGTHHDDEGHAQSARP